MQDYSLYVHIPFCTRKCDYCHFYVLPNQESLKDQLLDGLALEWNFWSSSLSDKKLKSIYFGGGTPSLFGPKRLEKILSMVPHSSGVEITLEANPENINTELMQQYADLGVNRVSIGIQTLDDHLLQLLSRTHDAKLAYNSVYSTIKAGITNISVDLMFDIPGQTLAHWKSTLNQVISLPIKHLSLYNLTFEPHTVFFKHQERLKKLLPGEEISAEMYKMAIEMLENAGLKRYEISAFARENYHSQHNTGYWTARPFLGLGPSAFSYWEGKRFRNVANLNKYSQALKEGRSPIDFEEQLEPSAQLRELFVVHLRLREGCNSIAFQEKYGPLDSEMLENIKNLMNEGLLEKNGDFLKLTDRGVLFYDTVASYLI